LTLNYQKNLTPGQMAELITKVNSVMKGPQGQFIARFNLEAWYGPQHTVRVLEPRNQEASAWPRWVSMLVEIEGRDTKYPWAPHIVCSDKSLQLRVVAVSLMCKKVEVARWDLS